MSLNRVTLLGHLGADPELTNSQKGREVIRFSLATSRKRKDSEGVEVELTNWHNCKAFGKLAQIVKDYLKKGSRVLIIGSINYYQYVNKEKKVVYGTEILVKTIKML